MALSWGGGVKEAGGYGGEGGGEGGSDCREAWSAEMEISCHVHIKRHGGLCAVTSFNLIPSCLCIPACSSAYLPVCLPDSLHACQACLDFCLPACLSTCLPTCLPACLPTYLPDYLPACLPGFLTTCLPACWDFAYLPT